jgi:hypothetical protein
MATARWQVPVLAERFLETMVLGEPFPNVADVQDTDIARLPPELAVSEGGVESSQPAISYRFAIAR